MVDNIVRRNPVIGITLGGTQIDKIWTEYLCLTTYIYTMETGQLVVGVSVVDINITTLNISFM